MQDLLKELNKELKNKNIIEFRIIELNDANVLTIVGSFDLGYYHNIEIKFTEVTYISCPINFDFATFRLATEEEKITLRNPIYWEEDDMIICILLDEDDPLHYERHFIAAKDFQYTFETVYYYKRENLKEGERIAEWVSE